jgi:hypothetical protein
MNDSEETSILEKLDAAVPSQLTRFDAFPKLPSTYKQRSESRGALTLLLLFVTFLLILNDIGEFLWGWPDSEFSVDADKDSYMNVNVDLVVNTPCSCESGSLLLLVVCADIGVAIVLSVDLRDAIGDRLYLSKSFRRDGVSNHVNLVFPFLTTRSIDPF